MGKASRPRQLLAGIVASTILVGVWAVGRHWPTERALADTRSVIRAHCVDCRGSLLDHSLIVYGGGMGNGNLH